MAKAYDRIEWGILVDIKKLLGFGQKFISIIHASLSTVSFSILLNGSLFGLFNAGKGIRQGNPISHALFTIFFDLLSKILHGAEVEGKIYGVKISRTSPLVTHLMYIDDLIIYCWATTEEAKNVKDYLDLFCKVSNQIVNFEKSAVHFSADVGIELQK